MRQVRDRLERAWGQQVVIDNKRGGNSWILLSQVKRVAPDGYWPSRNSLVGPIMTDEDFEDEASV
jgi:tripartite-type tricarboxylate transporter receptor subunit TctC